MFGQSEFLYAVEEVAINLDSWLWLLLVLESTICGDICHVNNIHEVIVEIGEYSEG